MSGDSCVRVGACSQMFLLSRLVLSKGEEEASDISDSSGSSSGSGREVGEKDSGGNAFETEMKLRELEKVRKKVLEKMEEKQRKWVLTVVGYDYVQCGVYCGVCVGLLSTFIS